MSLQLFAHPFSSYCQKVLIALYETATPFEFRMLDQENPANFSEFAALWPIGRFPLLLDDGVPVFESSVIIEHVARVHAPVHALVNDGSTSLIPNDPAEALETRLLDRVFDNYVMAPMQKIVADVMRPEGAKDTTGVGEARATLDKAYDWIDRRLAGRAWSAGGTFTLADCAAAPSLFYADWVHPIATQHARLRDHRANLLARASVARAVDEARPYRRLFPPGAPDRD